MLGLQGVLKNVDFFEIGITPLFIKNLSKILYGCSKMIFLCIGEDSIYSSTSTGTDVIMTSNCICNIICFIRTVENANGIK